MQLGAVSVSRFLAQLGQGDLTAMEGEGRERERERESS